VEQRLGLFQIGSIEALGDYHVTVRILQPLAVNAVNVGSLAGLLS
jgi:hypothetical protein